MIPESPDVLWLHRPIAPGYEPNAFPRSVAAIPEKNESFARSGKAFSFLSSTRHLPSLKKILTSEIVAQMQLSFKEESVSDCRRDSKLTPDTSTIFHRTKETIRRPTLRLAGIILGWGIFALLAQGSTAKPPDSENYTDPTMGSQYVGADTCKGCHEDNFKNIEASPHYRTNLAKIRGEEVHGCESCHGPGSAHVAGGGDKSKIFTFKGARPEAITKRCMTCHEANPAQREFMRSTHNENGVTCTSCHSVHHSKLENQLVQKQTPLCFSCHVEQRADFQKPFHHRVEEGLIKCDDCHNPHGALRDRQLRSTPDQDMVCFKCHSRQAWTIRL